MSIFSNEVKNPRFCFGVFTVILLLGLIYFSLVLTPSDFETLKITNFINVNPTNPTCRSFINSQPQEKESPNLCIIQKNSLAAASPPIIITPQVLGAIVDGSSFKEEESQKEIFEYIVESGDNLSSIADQFNISLNTVLWANDLNKNSIIKPGQKLIILPVSGVIHYVEKGETLSEIAEIYKADINKILGLNGLDRETKIFIGDILIIPDGVMPAKKSYIPSYTPLASSYFICPIPAPCRLTQGLHWYNAVDFGHEGISCGLPVFAAAEGTVQKIGYTSLGGNFVRLLHPNGVVTYYGHLQTILAKSGQKVSQGAIIGYVGHSGYTTPAGPIGCHLHFDVRGARNPFAR